MDKITITGAPNCTYCTMVESIIKKLGVSYTKVDLGLEENSAWLDRVHEEGNRMPACIFVGQARYAVGPKTPARIPPIQAWLKEHNAL